MLTLLMGTVDLRYILTCFEEADWKLQRGETKNDWEEVKYVYTETTLLIWNNN